MKNVLVIFITFFSISQFHAVNAFSNEVTCSPTLKAAALSSIKNLYDQALKNDKTVEELTKISHCSFFYAPYVKADKQQEKIYENGRNYAQKALGLNKNYHDAELWDTLNLIGLVRVRGSFFAIQNIIVARNKMVKLRKENPSIRSYAPDRVLGNIYFRAPSFISIGSDSRAEKYFKAALKGAPDFPANRLFYAVFLANDDRPQEAKKILGPLLGPFQKGGPFDKYPQYRDLWNCELDIALKKIKLASD